MSLFHFPLDQIVFDSADSQAYKEVGEWIYSGRETDHTLFRPFLFPLLLETVYRIGGIGLIIALQALLWIGSAILLNASLVKFKVHRSLRVVALITFWLNLTLIALTFHALTEIISLFLLTYCAWLMANRKEILDRDDQAKKGFIAQNGAFIWSLKMSFTLSVLTLIKPLFFSVWGVWVMFVFIKFVLRGSQKIKKFALILLSSVLIFVQLTLMLTRHQMFKVSDIGRETTTYYFLAKGVSEIEHIPYQEARVRALELRNSGQVKDYVLNHKWLYVRVFFENVRDNISAEPLYFSTPEGYEHWDLYKFMKKVNFSYYVLHIVFLFLNVFCWMLLWVKNQREDLWNSLALALLSYLIILSSGLSFWQGDRLIIFGLTLWLILYTSTIRYIYRGIIRIK